MKDQSKTKKQLIDELVELRRRIAELEKAEVRQNRAEEALQESEARYRAVVEDQTELICRFLPGGTLTFVNEAYCRYFDKECEDLIGSSFISLIPASDQQKINAHLDSLGPANPVSTHEHRVIGQNEEIRWQQWTNRAILDEKGLIKEFQSVGRDITDRKLAEEALRKAHDELERRIQERTNELLEANEQLRKEIKSRKRVEKSLRDSVANFRALAENANDGILIAVGEGTHVYANSRASEIMGYSTTELLEITLHEFTAPDEVEKVAERFRRRLKGENVPGQYETALVRKSGEIFSAELSSGRTVWEGQPASIVIFRDITERKQAVEELKRREAELEIRTEELEEVNSALRVLLKRREEDRTHLEEKVLANVKDLVLPYVERLKKTALAAKQDTYLNILESNLEDIVSPFVRQLSSSYLALTPTEIHIANLVKEARDSKTIAQLLNMSPRTVESHRQNIRKKLGLKNKKANLRTHLLSIQ